MTNPPPLRVTYLHRNRKALLHFNHSSSCSCGIPESPRASHGVVWL